MTATNMEPTLRSSSDVVISNPRPWVRWIARQIDYILFGVVVGVAIGVVMPEVFTNSSPRFGEMILGLLLAVLWTVVEALLVSRYSTTPGKWLLGTTIRAREGRKTSYKDALTRSMRVWWRGMGAGFPLISWITNYVAHGELMQNGTTSWDKEGGFIVEHEEIGIPRILTVVLVGVLYAFVSLA